MNELHGLWDKNFKITSEIIKMIFNFKPAEFCKKGVLDLPSRWRKVIENDGNYFVWIKFNEWFNEMNEMKFYERVS